MKGPTPRTGKKLASGRSLNAYLPTWEEFVIVARTRIFLDRFFWHFILVQTGVRRMASGDIPIKWKYLIDSAASGIPADGLKWRMVSALIRWPRRG
jgi:hypothetical protein